MKPRSRPRQLAMPFEDVSEEKLSWLPVESQRKLVTTLADLLLDAVNPQHEEGSDEHEDPR